MMEVFKDVAGFEGLYAISNTGIVKSLARLSANGRKLKGRVLKPGHTKYGYETVNLIKNGKTYNKMIHRLVAEAHIPNPHGCKVVNHKDRNPRNNRVENLEWCNQGYNITYSLNLLHRDHMQRGRQVVMTTENGEEYVFDSMTSCSRFVGLKKRWLSIKRVKFGNKFEYEGCVFEIRDMKVR